MTRREFWLKLFAENDTALATAIHLIGRFVTPQGLNKNQEFLVEKRRELNEEMDPETVERAFPGYLAGEGEKL